MIPYIYLRFYLKFEQKISGYFPEALIRGGLGHTLKKLICINKKEDDCLKCFIGKNCLFKIMFYKELEYKEMKIKNIATPPVPFVISVYRKDFASDFFMDMIMFKDLFGYVPNIVWSFLKTGENGIGKNRIRFNIEYIIDINSQKKIYDSGCGRLSEHLTNQFNIENEYDFGKDEIVLDFYSPLRLRINNKITDDPSFYDIIKFNFLRYTLLNEIYGDGNNNPDIKNMLEQSKDIEKINSNLYWKEQKRYSQKQNRTIAHDGIKGKIVFNLNGNNLFNSILKSGEIFGIGKNTAFGCGRYEIKDKKE